MHIKCICLGEKKFAGKWANTGMNKERQALLKYDDDIVEKYKKNEVYPRTLLTFPSEFLNYSFLQKSSPCFVLDNQQGSGCSDAKSKLKLLKTIRENGKWKMTGGK